MSGKREPPKPGAPRRPAVSGGKTPAHRLPLTAHCLQVTTTCGSRDEAERIARAAVEERLAACAQVQGPITSIYRWEGRLDQATEWYCHLKTTAARWAALEPRIRSLHSYQVPEIIALPILRGGAEYLSWIEDQVSGER